MPSFPSIGRSFGASPLEMQQTLTAYLIPFSAMMLFHGALADSFGRRPVILVGLVVFACASIGCAFAQSLPQMLAFRALQGMSSGTGMVAGRAMIRDIYAGHQAQRVMSMVTMIFGLARQWRRYSADGSRCGLVGVRYLRFWRYSRLFFS
jgi:DHA1 family bicyclomycin/chloramphenicol resistance-like MFS transporter